jgi:protease-4
MWYAAKKLREKKPLIVSMGDYAASGGYYMSCIADSIVAQPTTLTGSIGIFGMFPNVEGLLDKIGVNFDGVKTAKYADFGDISRPITEPERLLLQNYINNGYELFIARCAEGRGMSVDKIKKIAEGRVWTGSDAKELGLVDELGGLEYAVEIAAEKAGLANYRVAEYPAKKDFMTQLMESINSDLEAKVLNNKLGANAHWYNMLKRAESMQGVQALMPYVIAVN